MTVSRLLVFRFFVGVDLENDLVEESPKIARVICSSARQRVLVLWFIRVVSCVTSFPEFQKARKLKNRRIAMRVQTGLATNCVICFVTIAAKVVGCSGNHDGCLRAMQRAS